MASTPQKWAAAHAARRHAGAVARTAIVAELRRRELAREPAPSLRELAAVVGLAERTVRYHLAILSAAGTVTGEAGRARTLRLVDAPS
jgi:predicted transcriptional regulator